MAVPTSRSRLSRFAAARMEPVVLRAADAVTAVSRGTYEQALARTPSARPRALAELPIGWDARDTEFVSGAPSRVPSGDGCVHVSYVGTLLPTGIDTLRAVLGAVGRCAGSIRRPPHACGFISSAPPISATTPSPIAFCRSRGSSASPTWSPSTRRGSIISMRFKCCAIDRRAADGQPRTPLHAEQSRFPR